jgi:hypothetical protein
MIIIYPSLYIPGIFFIIVDGSAEVCTKEEVGQWMGGN